MRNPDHKPVVGTAWADHDRSWAGFRVNTRCYRVPMELFDSTVHWVDNSSNEPASTPTIAVIQTGTPVTLIITLMQVLSYKTYTEAKTEVACIFINHIIQIIWPFATQLSQ
jgi:hypothetical protein